MASSPWKVLSKHVHELRVHLCPTSPSSQGVRDFVLGSYVEIKKTNPGLPFLIREGENVEPRLIARYDLGKETSISVSNKTAQEVSAAVKTLMNKGPVTPDSLLEPASIDDLLRLLWRQWHQAQIQIGEVSGQSSAKAEDVLALDHASVVWTPLAARAAFPAVVMGDSSVIEKAILEALHENGVVEDTGALAATLERDHNEVVGSMKSLQAHEMVLTEDVDHFEYALTEEAKVYLNKGSPEAQLFHAIPTEGISMTELKTTVDAAVTGVGFNQAMAQKWIEVKKDSGTPLIFRKANGIVDSVKDLLQAIADGKDIPQKDITLLQKKRKLVVPNTWKTYKLTKGPKFALARVKQATDLTHEMILKGSWKEASFKAYNFNALGLPTQGGCLHPLLKVRTQFRKIFTQMGFEEMPSNAYVESSFWNFDALFQPQQHPARDAHDTFFLTKPASSGGFPEGYLERVKTIHEKGGFDSTGYGYAWKLAEAQKNLLRTHTTAVSSQMLYKLAQEGFKPTRYFSVDRVFRNEAIDRTHLAEFHQIEGLVCDKGLTLGDLMGTLRLFFDRLGLKKLRFKPAFNPYTEPSMEIFSYSEQLKKWMEVGNSGMFRPEMLRPMGLPEDVHVIAWGLSLERPTMILYGIDNIRDLFGHNVSLAMVKNNPICRLGM